MLQNVFKELDDKNILVFLDTENFVTNNTSEVDIGVFSDREKFIELYQEPIKNGWIFCFNTSLENVLKTIQEDLCCLVEFGFNSDTESKALEVGRNLVESLKKFKFHAHWDERAISEHKISTVITFKDLPEKIQDLIDFDEI